MNFQCIGFHYAVPPAFHYFIPGEAPFFKIRSDAGGRNNLADFIAQGINRRIIQMVPVIVSN